MPHGRNPYPVRESEWRALQELISKDTVSIFTPYQKEENRFTNGLVALLEMSSRCHGPPLPTCVVSARHARPGSRRREPSEVFVFYGDLKGTPTLNYAAGAAAFGLRRRSGLEPWTRTRCSMPFEMARTLPAGPQGSHSPDPG